MTRLGIGVMLLTIVLDFVLVLLSFIADAMLCGLLLNGRAHNNKRPYFALPLFLTAALTAAVGVLGQLVVFGPFRNALDEPRDFLLLCVLSFAMGMQNAAVATSTGQLVRPTHLTGPATDLGVHLAEILSARGQREELAGINTAILSRFGGLPGPFRVAWRCRSRMRSCTTAG